MTRKLVAHNHLPVRRAADAFLDQRELAALGKALPANYRVGEFVDFYAPPSGDKLYGKVVSASGDRVVFDVKGKRYNLQIVTRAQAEQLLSSNARDNGSSMMDPDEIKERMAGVQRQMDEIIRSGGRILMNDPLMRKFMALKGELARARREEWGSNDAKPSYEEWMKLVDRQCNSRSGMSVHDLPDCPFRDWYDSGVSAASAAARCSRAAKE